MDISILNHLFLLIFPFIIISFFILLSILNADMKGIIYLIGLTVSLLFTYLIGNNFSLFNYLTNANEICNNISIKHISYNLPINQNVIGYTLSYLLYSSIISRLLTDKNNNKIWESGSIINAFIDNIYLIVFFIAILIFDVIWNIQNSCFNFSQLLISIILGSTIGLLWGYIISTSNSKYLQYLTNNNYCATPKKKAFKCKKSKK
tara:strand:+ start:5342 stop:5956 length:615 start_codon:yes stop_codon:yes gene_type:complete